MNASVQKLSLVSEIDVEPTRIRVLIADDHPLIIAGIRRTIEHFDDIEVVGEAHSGPELLSMVERRRPAVVLMDLRMPGVTGVECIEQLRAGRPAMKVVVLSACDERPVIDAALRAGATAYILKSAHTVDIASVLRQTAGGAVFHAPSSIPGCAGAPAGADAPALTDRERSILSAVAAGMTTAAISRELWVSEHTVKFHLTNIYRKLGVANRAGAVRYALQHHLVTVP
ncbi:MAG TPA: response regulator transcription factor [Solirubrobacteraceae bacterium]|nr:response regulator transcription factor [Solirubrobacteraceae bacterium]